MAEPKRHMDVPKERVSEGVSQPLRQLRNQYHSQLYNRPGLKIPSGSNDFFSRC